MTVGQPWFEDEIYHWNVVRFLNRLAYMKDKIKVSELIDKINAPKRNR